MHRFHMQLMKKIKLRILCFHQQLMWPKKLAIKFSGRSLQLISTLAISVWLNLKAVHIVFAID